MTAAGKPVEHDAYIGLGSNLGERAATLDAAFLALGELPQTSLAARSSLYATAPQGAPGDDYLNAVALLRTLLTPLELLHGLQSIEARHGRNRPYANAPRTLDLDLLLYADVVSNTSELQLPHPRLHERAFVLLPLAELAPTLCIGALGSVQQLLPHVAAQRAARLAR